MTITPRVRHELSPRAELHDALPFIASADRSSHGRQASTDAQPPVVTPPNARWSAWEHARFLEALELFPTGPWAHVAWHIGSKTARQVMTHAQKYRQKLKRRQQREETRRRLDAAARAGAEQAERREAEARLEASASAQGLVIRVSTRPSNERMDVDLEEDAQLVAAIKAALAQLLEPPARSSPAQLIDEAPPTATNEPGLGETAVVLEDLIRWTDQFFAGLAPTGSEFEPLQ